VRQLPNVKLQGRTGASQLYSRPFTPLPPRGGVYDTCCE
jgi:hypothetical protein